MKKRIVLIIALAIILIVAAILVIFFTSSKPVGETTPTEATVPATEPTTVPTDAPTQPTGAPTEPTTIPTEPPTEAPTEPTTSQVIPCESIKISNQTIEFINKGDTWSIQVRTTPANTTDTITFTSNDPSVATIDQTGLITALSSGKAVITVTCGSITQTCYIVCNFYTTPSPTQKPTQAPTQKPTQKPTQNPTELEHIHTYSILKKSNKLCTAGGDVYYSYYCECGDHVSYKLNPSTHSLTRKTVREATGRQEGLIKISCEFCCYEETETIPKIAYLVDVVLVSHERPNECYLSDGTPILERIYGKEYCQVGDTLTYRIIMSDGSTNGYTVRNWHDNVADVTVNGDLITVKVTDRISANCFFFFSVDSNDMDNNWMSKGISMDVVLGDFKFTDLSGVSMYVTLRDYITNNGMESDLFLLNAFNRGELTSYTNGDPSKSISGTARYGYDDCLIIDTLDDWLKTYFDLVDAYKARGFTKVYMYYESGMAYEGGYSDIIVFKAC